jgi:hypothetical protein
LLAQSRRAARLGECPLLGEQPTCSGNAATSAFNPYAIERDTGLGFAATAYFD